MQKQRKMNTETNVIQMTKRKSHRLSREEIKALKSFCKSYSSIAECADVIGISRQVLDRVLLTGSGSPDKIQRILAALES